MKYPFKKKLKNQMMIMIIGLLHSLPSTALTSLPQSKTNDCCAVVL